MVAVPVAGLPAGWSSNFPSGEGTEYQARLLSSGMSTVSADAPAGKPGAPPKRTFGNSSPSWRISFFRRSCSAFLL